MKTNPDFDLRPIRGCLWGGLIAFAIYLVATIVGPRRLVDTPLMNWGFRKRFKLGPLSLNLSKRGISASGKFGRISTNTRTRRLRVALPFGGWWHSRSLSRRTRSRRP